MYQAASSSRVKLPLKPYKAPTSEPSIGYITFGYAGQTRSGVRIRDMLSGSAARMVSQPDDVAVKGVRYAKLRLYLTWPGYSSAATFATIDCYNVSRASLVVAVSRHVAAFVEVCFMILRPSLFLYLPGF